MQRFVLIGVVFLAACNGPSPHFRDLPATGIGVNGSLFDIRMRGQLAEAVRIDRDYAPRFGPIRGRAGWAMRLASGCDVVWVLGDQALATGRLDCTAPARRRTARALRACRRAGPRPWGRPGYPLFLCPGGVPGPA